MTLKEKIKSRKARIGVIGMGYVGLPLAVNFLRAGFPVTGFDTDAEKVARLCEGKTYIKHIPATLWTPYAGKFSATVDMKRLREIDAVVICVPTPLTANREPDISYVERAGRYIADSLDSVKLVSLESTTYPGTTDEVLRPILEAGGRRVGRNFYLVYSPEREDPGNDAFSVRNIPKVVGGVTPACREHGLRLYSAIVERTVPVSSTRVAEATKLLENIYRSVNIALVNEMKMLFDRMGINVWEVIEASRTKPFGFQAFYPGPGLGGHCIPIDPFYLTWKARQYDFVTRFIELAGEINTGMPYYVIERTCEELNRRGRSLHKARVLILGVAYKKDVDDMRESPALKIIRLFQERGARVSYNDPYIPRISNLRHYDFNLRSRSLTPRTLRESDAVVIVTNHSRYDYHDILRHSRLVVDTRNAIPGRAPNLVKA
ncbi:MAG TPA: nucleotide sugar dehydrogenase [bacterium]|nr:nucleotide sugar dehydrogenase [bacterium]HNS49244.1 nucleotide sugar dehydrogenase [bacterium]